MTPAPRLSIVIVSYNGGRLVLDCLQSIRDNPPDQPFEAIVVDNASRDRSADDIAARFPEVRLLRLPKNLGLTGGFNAGLREARGDLVLSLDSDTEVRPGAIDLILATMESDPTIGACGATLIYPDGTPQRTARRFPHPMNGLFGRRSVLTRVFPDNRFSRRYLMSEHESDTDPYDVDTLSTACMMIGRPVVEQVGGYDEGFFVYWSDTDWCRRIKLAGWRILSVPQSVVVHNENLKARHRAGRRVRMIMDFHQGAYRYFRKHHVRSALSPLNLIAIAGLGGRAALLLAADEIRILRQRVRERLLPGSAV
ncbi:MAG: glycosyltransferase family 2 protein [Geminicoccaceae bacterium]